MSSAGDQYHPVTIIHVRWLRLRDCGTKLLTATSPIHRIRGRVTGNGGARASLYNVMAQMGKHICTKVGLFQWRIVLALFAVAICVGAAALFVPGSSAGEGRPQASPLPVFLLDAKQLEVSRQAVRAGDRSLAAAWTRLKSEADKVLKAGPFSIVDKAVTPPSGDKHDYMSQAPYFWPDPNKPNGLPYIRRDGERNPEINRITDHRSIDD